MSRVVSTLRRHKVLAAIFLVAVTLALGFATVMAVHAIRFRDHVVERQPVEPWMTIRYVARAWQVPPDEIGAALGVDRDTGKGRSLNEIAEMQGLTPEEAVAAVERVLAEKRLRP
jgi:hypothetical protein